MNFRNALHRQVLGSLNNGERKPYQTLLKRAKVDKLAHIIGESFHREVDCSPENVRHVLTHVKENLAKYTTDLRIGIDLFVAMKENGDDFKIINRILFRPVEDAAARADGEARSSTPLSLATINLISSVYSSKNGEPFFDVHLDEVKQFSQLLGDKATNFTGSEIAEGMLTVMNIPDDRNGWLLGTPLVRHLHVCGTASHKCKECVDTLVSVISVARKEYYRKRASLEVHNVLLQEEDPVACKIVRALFYADQTLKRLRQSQIGIGPA